MEEWNAFVSERQRIDDSARHFVRNIDLRHGSGWICNALSPKRWMCKSRRSRSMTATAEWCGYRLATAIRESARKKFLCDRIEIRSDPFGHGGFFPKTLPRTLVRFPFHSNHRCRDRGGVEQAWMCADDSGWCGLPAPIELCSRRLRNEARLARLGCPHQRDDRHANR